ncbi:MAG TPA: thiolase family protein [Candidatus Entotheonella sp.]|jgi:acetyl-CoA acetyltransferase
MTLRGKTAIVGIGELPTRRTYPGRTTQSLCTEAARLAIDDAGLTKSEIDGVVTRGNDLMPLDFAEYMGLHVGFCEGVTQHGSSGAHSVVVASMAINSGLAHAVLCVFGGTRDPNLGGFGPGQARGAAPASKNTEFEAPYGLAPGANTGYGLMKQRHMYEFGTTQEQFAKMAVNQRFNALTNPNAVFQGQPITIENVLNSRMVNTPLHLLECVMPCAGAAACIVTSAERALSLPNPPVYLLGAAAGVSDHDMLWQSPRMTTTPVAVSARKAYEMAGYGPRDIQFAEFYD